MRVSPIIQQQYPVQSFKGLWGATKEEQYMLDSSYYIYEFRKVKDYHPFLDEAPFEIENIVKQNEYFKGGLEDMVNADSCKINIKETLNFTRNEWEKYLAGKLKGALDITSRLTAELIETNLKNLNLAKHIKL